MPRDEDLKWAIAREIPHMRRFAALLNAAPHQADDLVQDCLERALRKRHLWHRQGSLRSWLFRLLYRLHIDRARASRRRDALHDAAALEICHVAQPRQEQRLAVHDIMAAMADLPADQRAAILLVGVEGLSYEETAAVLDIPLGTLRSRLSRGRDALRQSWKPPSTQPVLRRVK